MEIDSKQNIFTIRNFVQKRKWVSVKCYKFSWSRYLW